MKQSLVRPFFRLVLLVAIAATLSFRILLLSGPTFLNDEGPTKSNATLLKYASIDLGEAMMKQDIQDLVEANFRGSTHGHQRTASDIPILPRSPKYNHLWLNCLLNLQEWSRKRRFQPDVMSNLVTSLSSLGLEKKLKTCAVVGNSGILLKSRLGGVIDSHEFVIRLKNARTMTYENDVGKKTSISFINSNVLNFCARRDGCYCHPYGENVPIVMYICQAVHFLDYTLCSSAHKAPLVVTDPGLDILCSRIVKYYSLKRFLTETGKSMEEWGKFHDGSIFHYSSGMQAVMLAMSICDNVSIFGFGKSNSTKHHYHTNQKAELAIHDFEAEYDLYRDMVARPQVIPFVSNKFKFPRVVFHQ